MALGNITRDEISADWTIARSTVGDQFDRIFAALGVALEIIPTPVALGTGAAATLGKVGTPGPLTAAQYGWLEVVDSQGTHSWIPVFR